MEPLPLLTVAVLAAAGGVAIGVLLRSLWASQTMKAATSEARRIEAEARARQKELILEAKDEKLRMQREAEEEARARRAELAGLESRLLQRDEQLDQRTDMLEQRDRKLLERERELDKTREDLARAHSEQVVALERVANMSAEDAKGILIEAVREEAEHDAVKIARAIERSAREDAQDKARDIVVTAIQRVAADHTAEHTVSVVHLPSDEMKGRIIGREGRNIRALEQATGIDLIIDDTPETVILSGFDPVRREIARLAITKLIDEANKWTKEQGIAKKPASEAPKGFLHLTVDEAAAALDEDTFARYFEHMQAQLALHPNVKTNNVILTVRQDEVVLVQGPIRDTQPCGCADASRGIDP
jgi:ribonuclease Y